MKIKLEITATASEMADLVALVRNALTPIREVQHVRLLETIPNPETLRASDQRRYRATGRVDDFGQPEMVDLRTGRRGVMMDWCGWTPGAYVCADGRVEFDHPWDNPLQGCSWS